MKNTAREIEERTAIEDAEAAFLSQDLNEKLARWLSSRIEARRMVRDNIQEMENANEKL